METAAIMRMKELVQKLDRAAKAYYQQDTEIISNREYDQMYDELQALEKETGTVLANSPTISVGYEAVDQLPKEEHESPMLSLDKTKDREVLREFIGEHKTLLSWKLDGLTIVLTYENGELAKAVTRGNGVTGEVVTNNARVFKNVPLKIPYQGRLVLRGEAIITYSDFERINESIEDVDAKYKNPRNLCSGSVRQLNNEITARRNVRFYAFTLVSADGVDFHNSRARQFEWLKEQGFDVVEYRTVTASTLDEAMEYFSTAITENDFPSDGLVALYDDIAYGDSLGRTAKFPRNAFAFKWADEIRETHLLEIEWSPSRTGLINPVAVFEPVELEGTTVSRASVHNVSILKELQLGIGDTITVYKANMIIPQIAENLTRSSKLEIPDTCPACGHGTQIQKVNDVEALYCTNPDCAAKHIGMFERFVCRDGLNVVGLSTSKLEQLIDNGFIRNRSDLFSLSQYEGEIASFDGWGEKSAGKLMQAIAKARTTTFRQFFYCLGIPGCGHDVAKILEKEFGKKTGCSKTALLSNLIGTADILDTLSMDGIGDVRAKAMQDWFETNEAEYKKLLNLLTISDDLIQKKEISASLEGMTFVITGAVHIFKNRNALKEEIESRNGKVSGSVSSKTDYLISNEPSTSAKSVKAAKLGVPVITEEEFLEKFITQEE